MKRRLFNILSALSLVLFLAMGVLWVRSYWVADNLTKYSNPQIIGWASIQGRLMFGVWEFQNPQPPVRSGWQPLPLGRERYPDVPGWRYLGFDVQYDHALGRATTTNIIIPHWFVLGLSMFFPVRWFRRWRRNRLAERKGLCLTCGYDLRASVERCPECGTAIPAGASPVGEVEPDLSRF